MTGTDGSHIHLSDTSRVARAGDTLTGALYTKGPVFDVRAFGATGDGLTDDTDAIQEAINFASTSGVGAKVYLSPGGYYVPRGLTLPSRITLCGDGAFASTLRANSADVTVLTMEGGFNTLYAFGIWGKGANHDVGSFGATKPALKLAAGASNNYLRELFVLGGSMNMEMLDGDNDVDGCQFWGGCYGQASAFIAAGNWFVRTKFDTGWPAQYGQISSILPWADSADYQVGALVSLSGYVMQCIAAGKSDSKPPALKNYGVDIIDGSIKWWLAKPMNNYGVLIEGMEVSFIQCDFTGAYSHCVGLTNSAGSASGPQYVYFDQCCLSQATDSGILCVGKGGTLTVANSRIGCGFLANGIGVDTGNGWLSSLKIHDTDIGGFGTALYGVRVGAGRNISIHDNEIVGAKVGIYLDSGVRHVKIHHNELGSGTAPSLGGANVCPVQVCSDVDYYNISDNIFEGATGEMIEVKGVHRIVERNLL
jgi:hypothetical protein